MPSFHVSQIHHKAFHRINDSGHSKPNCLDFRVYCLQTPNFANKGVD